MTEQEWLDRSASRREYLLDKVAGRGRARLSRLCAVACCRRLARLLPDPRCLAVLDRAEEFADNPKAKTRFLAAHSELEAIASALPDNWPPLANGEGATLHALNAVRVLADRDKYFAARSMQLAATAAAAAALPASGEYDSDVLSDHPALAPEQAAQVVTVRDLLRRHFVPVTFEPAWRTQVALALAQAAYDERNLPSGGLDPTRLAVLADALEEAGCTDEAILTHLRSPGPHVRGCWALDLVLGKS